MMPSQVINAATIRSPRSLVGFLVRLTRAVLVLTIVCLAWLLLLVLFLPLLLLVEVMRLGTTTAQDRQDEPSGDLQSSGARSSPDKGNAVQELVFDRRRDVSKLFGCNTRNVRYRWNIFAKRLDDLRKEFDRPVALDFGAGSLRDSYELAKQGFRVVSVDLNEDLIKHYYESYDWNGLESPTLSSTPFEAFARQTAKESFHLALTFDVIEHLEDPENYLKQLQPLLHEKGLFFCVVPNGRTFREGHYRRALARNRQTRVPGVPHLQFRSPEEWIKFLEQHGFEVIEHEMAIGPLVNDLWHTFLGLSVSLYVAPMFSYLPNRKHRLLDPAAFERLFYPAWLMERVNVIDTLFARWLKPWYAWNLIVARKRA